MYNNWPKWVIEEGNSILKSLDFKNRWPKQSNVLAFTKTDFHKIKIIILGQDPYPTPHVANGHAFAVNLDQKIPMSLKQIFKEIENEQQEVVTGKDLKHWTNNGVLLLNTALTVIENKPGSDSQMWHPYIEKVLKLLGRSTDLIWILWGNHAKKWKHVIKSQRVIEDAHPSPLSRKWRQGTWIKEIKKWDSFKF